MPENNEILEACVRMTDWCHQTFGSGTQIVRSASLPWHFYVYAGLYEEDHVKKVMSEVEQMHLRSQCCQELRDFLNGHEAAWWIPELQMEGSMRNHRIRHHQLGVEISMVNGRRSDGCSGTPVSNGISRVEFVDAYRMLMTCPTCNMLWKNSNRIEHICL